MIWNEVQLQESIVTISNMSGGGDSRVGRDRGEAMHDVNLTKNYKHPSSYIYI